MTRQNLHSQNSYSQAQYSQHYTAAHCSNWSPPQEREMGLPPNRRQLPVPPPHRTPSTPQGLAQNAYTTGFGSPRQPQRPPRLRKRVRHQSRSRRVLLAGGSMVALAALIVVPKPSSTERVAISDVCQQKIASQAVLSRGELSKLLAVPERSSKDAVRQIIDAPYCTLGPIEVREGALAEREAYPLEFDPQTWFVVLYEEGEYAGYDFSFRQE